MPGQPRRPALERLAAMSAPADCGYATPCQIKTGKLTSHGYGQIHTLEGDRRRMRYAHALVWEAANGPIPSDLQVDHLCRNRACHRIDHLELVPQTENILRGEGYSARNARKTHCSKGHEFTPENTRLKIDSKGRTSRRCITCDAARERARTKRLPSQEARERKNRKSREARAMRRQQREGPGQDTGAQPSG